jgi:pSer/pThr/pTyr-binding forkhead associated (FHA) protein
MEPAQSQPAAGGIATLLEREGPRPDAEHDLTVGTFVLGRGDADLVFNDKDVSRRHAEVRIEADAAFVRDLGSKNGVRVNDENVPTGEEVELLDGARLRVGGVVLELCHEGARVRRALTEAGEPTRTRTATDPLGPAPARPNGGVLFPLVLAGAFAVAIGVLIGLGG